MSTEVVKDVARKALEELTAARAEVARLKDAKPASEHVGMSAAQLSVHCLELKLKLNRAQAGLAASQKRADGLAVALRWYAENNSWQAYGSLSEYHPKIRDCGQIAKAALAQHDAEGKS